MAKKFRLVVERNGQGVAQQEPFVRGQATVLITPPIDEAYWLLRVQVGHGQSIVLFPKFGTFGIGFTKEEKDWNTNLPYSCATEEIYNHIKVNKGRRSIPRQRCLDAIRLLQQEITKLTEGGRK